MGSMMDFYLEDMCLPYGVSFEKGVGLLSVAQILVVWWELHRLKV